MVKWLSDKEPTWQRRRLKRHGFDYWVKKIPWKRAWQPTPVFLPGESHGQRGLVVYSLEGCKELDMTEVTQHTHSVCKWIIQVSSDTENWRTELKARLAVSFKKIIFPGDNISYISSELSLFHIDCLLFSCFYVFFFSSALFPHTRSLYSCTIILLEASNVVSFQEMALFFPIFFHEHCQFIVILSTSFLSYHHLFDFTFPSWF